MRLFSKIRYKLAAEYRVGKYLRYAVGEILLVVIGILLALQLNNWNEKQKLAGSEQEILKSLLKEFRYNQDILEETIKININNLKAAQEIGKYTGPQLQQQDEKQLSDLMVGAFKYMVNYLPSMGTLYDVINSGKLSLISNQELRSLLAAFESELDDIHRQENDVKDEQNVTHSFFITEGNFRRHLTIINDALIVTNPSRFPKNDFKFLENPEFESHLYYYIVMAANLDKNFYQHLKAKQDAIIHLIQSEIH